jgi:signal transduction histidine kinase
VFNSVRVRLTFWYTGIFGLVLVLFAGGLYIVFSRRVLDEQDRALAAALDVCAASLRHEIEEHEGKDIGERNFEGVLRTIHQASFPRQAISVFDGQRLIASKEGAARAITAPPTPADPFTTLGAQRFAVRRVRLDVAPADYLFVSAEPLDRVHSEIRDIAGILLIAVPFALGLAAAAGYVLARKSLAPVVAMSGEVDRITAGSLGERLSVVNRRDELGRLAATFNRLLERLDEAFDQQRRFMADASHELRTPIAVSRTAAEVMLDGPHGAPAEYREALAVVAKQMQRLSRVVNDMFLLARADSGEYAVQRREFYLNDVVEEVVTAARLLASSKRIRVGAAPMTESPYDGDEDLVRQLLLILLDNAVKYTPEDGAVEVVLEPGYTITVADTGPGVPADARETIFGRFVRVDKARSRSAPAQAGGAGLGLSIARWIAGVHGGAVTLRTSSRSGSVFAVELPRSVHSDPSGIEKSKRELSPPGLTY